METKQFEKLIKQYPDTPYAALAALGMAKESVGNDSLESAEVHLNWVIDNSAQAGLVHTARLRLARVLAAQEKYDQALALVETSTDSSYASLYSEIHGDILLAKGDADKAKASYENALNTSNEGDQRRQFISMKINDLSLGNNN